MRNLCLSSRLYRLPLLPDIFSFIPFFSKCLHFVFEWSYTIILTNSYCIRWWVEVNPKKKLDSSDSLSFQSAHMFRNKNVFSCLSLRCNSSLLHRIAVPPLHRCQDKTLSPTHLSLASTAFVGPTSPNKVCLLSDGYWSTYKAVVKRVFIFNTFKVMLTWLAFTG